MTAGSARARGYALLSRLVLDGVDEDMARRLQAVPPLAEALGSQPDLDAVAAEHYRLLSFAVPPYAGAFLDDAGLVGGRHAEQLADLYAAHGFPAQRSDASADHLGVILGALSWGDVALQQTLLDEHLLRWLPAWLVALDGEASGLWQLVIELVAELALDHRVSLGALPDAVPPLAAAPPLLDDDATGLRGIANYLSIPRHAGALITRGDIGRIGSALNVPRGFGSRANMIESLLRGAAEYDSFADTMSAFEQCLAQRDAALAERAERYPALAPWTAPWRQRIAETRQLLGEMQRRAPSAA